MLPVTGLQWAGGAWQVKQEQQGPPLSMSKHSGPWTRAGSPGREGMSFGVAPEEENGGHRVCSESVP